MSTSSFGQYRSVSWDLSQSHDTRWSSEILLVCHDWPEEPFREIVTRVTQYFAFYDYSIGYRMLAVPVNLDRSCRDFKRFVNYMFIYAVQLAKEQSISMPELQVITVRPVPTGPWNPLRETNS